MPGKHVRFAASPTYYPSSTPTYMPSKKHHYFPQYTAPYSHKPYPTSTSTYSSRTPRIHSLLAYSFHPTLYFDVRLPLSVAITFSSPRLSTRSLSESATDPPVSSMTLYIPHITWSIIVAPSNGLFITVADVVNAIYYTLRIPVMKEEYRAIRSRSNLRRVNTAYERRHERIRDDYAAYQERQGGVRRVDFLVGHTQFLGVSTTGRNFILNLSY
ncbi:hypothetical protein D9758_005292 [Tetrapyrgos nigripes]|uniref:DUF6699 domain-containing protein n=1 Tax=Tetrapyrgos nigripes TaxID=182062 RepID=A0A8H5GXC1_9AGAR|nr:hypothetical protein D9758_005292 [Tetrapyrgos nigripes]